VSTAAFLDLSILRSRRRREAIVAQVVLYALILGFDLTWIYLRQPELARAGMVAFLTSGGVAWVWVITAALAAFAVRQRRKLGRELEMLTSLRRQLGDPRDALRG
jgi:protein-S-isoprenylcysteine O-methyltransferase Ste14